MASTEMNPQDRAWLCGHRSGYLDALAALWDMGHEAAEARDKQRSDAIFEIAQEVRLRMTKAVDEEKARILAPLSD